jgi:plasmid stabilization system protein ParE
LKIRFARQAAKDIRAALAFWRERQPGVPSKLVEDVLGLAERLAREEFDGPERRLKTGMIVRSWPLPPYRLFYRRREGVLEVMRIYHQARRPVTRK